MITIYSETEPLAPRRRAAPLWAADPTTIPGYQLLARLGSGGMAGRVLRLARHRRPPGAGEILRFDGAAQSCRREFELAGAVDENITAAPIAYGQAATGAYLVTSYLPGYRSGTATLSPATPIRQLWEFGATLARVLASVHRRGVVHCDVKPSNLLIRGTDLRLIDFGISRYLGESGDDDGIVQLSRGWAAPEQLRNTPATPALDVFAWGCLLAIVSTGIHPFASDDNLEWILRIESTQPDLAGLPTQMTDVVRAALAHDPSDRPPASELERLCHHQAHQTPPSIPLYAGRERRRVA